MKNIICRIQSNTFLNLFMRFYKGSESDLTSISVAYYFLVSIFPTLLVLVNLLPYFHINIDKFLDIAEQILPDYAYQVGKNITPFIVTGPSSGLFSVSVLVSIWTLSKSITILQKALNKAYNVQTSRGLFLERIMGFVVSIGLQLFLASSLFFAIFWKMFLSFLHRFCFFDNKQSYDGLINITQWIAYATVFCVMIMIYYFLPSVKIKKIRYTLPGSLFVVAVLFGLSNGLNSYFDRYVLSRVINFHWFGSFVLLTVVIWFIFIARILIIGAIFNASYQRMYEEKFETSNFLRIY